MIEHLIALGVTAVQLLPVHFHVDEPHLQSLGMTNYWGYNTAAFFAPHPGYATEAAQAAGRAGRPGRVQGHGQAAACRRASRSSSTSSTTTPPRAAPDGRTLSFRGLGEMTYYRNDGHGKYVDTTGCGNSLNFGEPRVIQLVLDSLRYWVTEFHIDGFRFDLAVTLGRNAANEFDPRHPFLVAIGADPVLSGVKLIAEPWDIGYGRLADRPVPRRWVDWNDHFRDAVRSFWLADRAAIDAGGSGGTVARLATPSPVRASLFEPSSRSRLASRQLRHRPRRLHPGRPDGLRPQAQRGQRRAEP